MADEEQTQQQPAPKAAKGGLVKTIGLAAGVLVVAIVAAVLVWLMVLNPMLNKKEGPEPDPGIPETAQWYSFEESTVHVVMPPGSNLPASYLLYQVDLLVSDAETAAVIEGNLAWFEDEIRKLHSHLSRESLDEPMLEESIQAQILQRCNEVLKSIMGDKMGEHRVLEVKHRKFSVVDQ